MADLTSMMIRSVAHNREIAAAVTVVVRGLRQYSGPAWLGTGGEL